MKDRRYFTVLLAELAVVGCAVGLRRALGEPYGDFARDLVLMISIVVFSALDTAAKVGRSHLLLLVVQVIAVAVLAYGLQFAFGEPHGDSVRDFVIIGFVVVHYCRLARHK